MLKIVRLFQLVNLGKIAYIKFFDMLVWKVVIPPYQEFPLLLVILLEIACGVARIIWRVEVIVIAPVGASRVYHV